VAPQLGITYTYLSKIENNAKLPSADLIERIATYYGEESAQLLAATGRLPSDVVEVLKQEPDKILALLRERLG
jgi:transcriptional regulator with XRE-family HTH domain